MYLIFNDIEKSRKYSNLDKQEMNVNRIEDINQTKVLINFVTLVFDFVKLK
jgi:hypothetical protein